MIPVWHQDNNSTRATVADICALLELNNIPFKMEPSTTIKDHTCFLVNPWEAKTTLAIITQETGRFSKELQDLQLTEEESAAVAAKELLIKQALENKQRLYDLRKAQEARIVELLNAKDEEEDEDEVTIDELIAKEEKE